MSRQGDSGVAEWLREVRAEYWAVLERSVGEDETAGDLHVLFQVGGRRLAVEAVLCKGVVRKPGLTRLPGLPPHILGVAGVRGEIVSVTDPARYLGIPGERPPDRGFLLILVARGVRAALWVDRVFDVRPLPTEKLCAMEAPQEGEASAKGLVRGQWETEEGPVFLLDGERYLLATAVGVGADPAT